MDVTDDFARLHATVPSPTSLSFGGRPSPVFSAVHSVALAAKYGREDPLTYMRNPGLRSLDTRQAAFDGLQAAGAGLQRGYQRLRGVQSTQAPAASPTAAQSPARPSGPRPGSLAWKAAQHP